MLALNEYSNLAPLTQINGTLNKLFLDAFWSCPESLWNHIFHFLLLYFRPNLLPGTLKANICDFIRNDTDFLISKNERLLSIFPKPILFLFRGLLPKYRRLYKDYTAILIHLLKKQNKAKDKHQMSNGGSAAHIGEIWRLQGCFGRWDPIIWRVYSCSSLY